MAKVSKKDAQLDDGIANILGPALGIPNKEEKTDEPSALKIIPGGQEEPKHKPTPKVQQNVEPEPNLEPEKDEVGEGVDTIAKGKKINRSYLLTLDCIDKVADCVVDLQTKVPGIGLGEFVEEALRTAIKKAERKHNDGKPFPARNVEPRRGRRIA